MGWEAIISAIAVGVIGIVISQIKNHFEKKSLSRDFDKKLTKQVSFITDEIKGVSTIVTNIQTKLDQHIDENDFKVTFSHALRSKSNQFSYSSLSLNQKYKNILGYWSTTIEKFGLNYFDNKNRGKDYSTLEKDLNEEILRELEDFNIYVDDLVPELKIIKNKKFTFSSYLEEFQIHNKTHVLVLRLVENGFTDANGITDTTKIVGIFVKYLDGFFTNFATALNIWEAAETYNFKEELVR